MNGLTWPLDSRQVLAWFLTAAPCVCYFTVNFAVSTTAQANFWTPLFLCPYLLGVLLFVGATLSTHPIPQIFSSDYGHYCRFCKEVVPNTAKHCRMCNKCRVGFDHHCRYINNCVTKSNYYIFFFGCLFLVSSAIIGLAQLIVYAATFKTNKQTYLTQAALYYNTNNFSEVVFWVIYGISSLFYLGLIIPMMVLIIYHMFFQVNGISTYDYIMDNISRFPQRLSRFSCIKNSKIRRK